MRLSNFSVVTKIGRASFRIDLQTADLWHELYRAVITNPRAGFMTLPRSVFTYSAGRNCACTDAANVHSVKQRSPIARAGRASAAGGDEEKQRIMFAAVAAFADLSRFAGEQQDVWHQATQLSLHHVTATR